MAETATTANLGWDNFFSTTTTASITSTTTTIPLADAPSPTEGFLVLDPGGANEIIFYNSKSGNSVIVPSTDDRGRGDTTAQAHSSGITVKMNTVGMMFEALQAGTSLATSAISTAKIADGAVTVVKRSGGFYSGQIAGATVSTTGNKSVTGVGFTPKAVLFEVGFAASTTNANSASGWMTAAAQAYAAMATDTSASTAFARNSSTAACIGWVGAGSSTPALLCTYVSMDADGFTINVGTASGTFPINYIALG